MTVLPKLGNYSKELESGFSISMRMRHVKASTSRIFHVDYSPARFVKHMIAFIFSGITDAKYAAIKFVARRVAAALFGELAMS
ncbi:MAG: hypothetical protein ABI583_10335 [Betaproteobacteria bacterium]